MIDMTGQVAIVTGAGRGLGRLYALELAARGAQVVVNDLGAAVDGSGSDPAVADRVVTEIVQAGGDAVASYDSVETPESGAAIVGSAVERFGRLDVLVSNAGIFGTRPFEDLTPAEWRRMLLVHMDGGFHVAQPAYRVMKAQGYGRFVFIASSAGLFGQPQVAHYAAAKAGLTGLANVVAIEGAEHGVLANTVLPFGYSRMVTGAVGESEQLPEVAAFLDAIDPRLVVPLVVFLASPHCHLTHHAFSACAGRFARVFVGLGAGWSAGPGAVPTAEDVAAHLAEVSSTEGFTIPLSIFDEVAEVATRLGITG